VTSSDPNQLIARCKNGGGLALFVGEHLSNAETVESAIRSTSAISAAVMCRRRSCSITPLALR
jgi:hypothetical protein